MASLLKSNHNSKSWTALISIAVVIFFIITAFTAPIMAYEYSFQDRIYRGVAIDGIQVGGLSKEEAVQKISESVAELRERGIQLRHGSKTATMKLTSFAIEDPDLAYDVAAFDVEQMVDQAYD